MGSLGFSKKAKLGRLSWRAFAVGAVVFALVASLVGVRMTSASSFSLNPSTIPVPGISSDGNNVAFAYDGQYALWAAFAPSVDPPDDAVLDERFDNHWIYGIKSQDPSVGFTKADLRLYYPTIVKFDERSDRVYARGTSYEKDSEGFLQPVDRITYLNINKSLTFDGEGVSFEIPGIESRFSSGGPADFALGQSGKYLLFTNGASIFTFNISVGYTYRVDIVPPSQFSENYSIARLEYDENSQLLTVVVCGRKFKKGDWQYFSDIYFYHLVENGTLDLVKQVLRDRFPDSDRGTSALTAGSNVAISPDGGQAFFVTDNGDVCSVRLDDSGLDGTVTRLASFDELRVVDDGNRGSRLITYDPASNTLGVVKPGTSVFIKRPIYNRPGPGGGNAIKRPIYVRSVEAPALVLAQLNKKNRVTKNAVVSQFDGQAETSISNIAFDGSGRGLIATGSGSLLSIDFDRQALSFVGNLGSRADSLTYNSAGASLVGVNSFEIDESGRLTVPGKIALAKLSDDGTPAASLTAAVLSPFSLGGHSVLGIRRPCALAGR